MGTERERDILTCLALFAKGSDSLAKDKEENEYFYRYFYE